MIFTSILFLIVAKALPSINKNITSVYFTRISAIIFIYAGVLSLNTLYIQSIGSGIGIYSGLFQITQVSLLIESFLLIIGSFILIAWPLPNLLVSPAKANLINNTNVNVFGTVACSSFLPAEVATRASNTLISKSADYSLIVLFSSLGSCLLISCFDLVSLYLCIELQSFGLYVLSTLYKESETSTKAGLKYFLLGGLSSCIILLGCGLIYSYTGLTNFESIYTIISTSYSISGFNIYLPGIASQITENASWAIQGLSLGLVLIFIGFLFKIAAAPLHNWSPDVYDEVPTIVTIWLTIIPKIAILILLLELQYYGLNLVNISSCSSANLSIITNSLEENTITYSTSNILNSINLNSIQSCLGLSSVYISATEIVKNLLLISSFLSLLIGTVVGLAQTRIKRLLAYSTISHIGFILLALAINTESSIDSLFFYIIQYTITNLNIFLIILALSYITSSRYSLLTLSSTTNYYANKNIGIAQQPGISAQDIRYITELKGQIYSNPILSLSLAVCLFSMAGTPPLIGFFSKQFVLYSAIQNGYYFITIIAILVSVISASYYLKIVALQLIDYEESSTTPDYYYSFSEVLVNYCLALKKFNFYNKNSEESSSTNAIQNLQQKLKPSLSSSKSTNAQTKGEVSPYNQQNSFYLSNAHSYLISVLTLVILLFILKPSLILNSTQLLSLSLFNW